MDGNPVVLPARAIIVSDAQVMVAVMDVPLTVFPDPKVDPGQDFPVLVQPRSFQNEIGGEEVRLWTAGIGAGVILDLGVELDGGIEASLGKKRPELIGVGGLEPEGRTGMVPVCPGIEGEGKTVALEEQRSFPGVVAREEELFLFPRDGERFLTVRFGEDPVMDLSFDSPGEEDFHQEGVVVLGIDDRVRMLRLQFGHESLCTSDGALLCHFVKIKR